VPERQLDAGDRPQATCVTGLGELHRAVEAITIGHGERLVAESAGGYDKLVGSRGAFEE
jgi:hypothetical protein